MSMHPTFPNATGMNPTRRSRTSSTPPGSSRSASATALPPTCSCKANGNLEFNLSGLYIKEEFDNYNQSIYNFLSLTPGEVDSLIVGPTAS